MPAFRTVIELADVAKSSESDKVARKQGNRQETVFAEACQLTGHLALTV
jgi:hypothetical protein